MNEKDITIEFNLDDRMKGFELLWFSNIGFDGIGSNMFFVKKEHLTILDNEGIKYKILKEM